MTELVRSPSPAEPHPALKGMHSSLIGILLNLVLAVGKALAGYFGHSFALIADAIESFSDVLSSAVVYFGLRVAIRPPDDDHPYGHGKAEPIAATAVGLALIAAAFAIAAESIHEIITPHRSPAWFTLIVAAGVFSLKELLFRYVVRVGNTIESTAVKADAWHHRSDAITSGLAFIGIAIALIGGRGYENADDWAALFASFIVLFNGYRQTRSGIAELLDAAPQGGIERDVRHTASSVRGVVDLEKCFVRKMGFDFYVDLHVIVDGDLPVREGHRIAHVVEDAIRSAHPKVAEVLVHIEPAA
jgi:cation diffusion facilitator family transporter